MPRSGAVERTQAIQLLPELDANELCAPLVTAPLLDRAAADPKFDAPLLDYVLSPFGHALLEYVARTMTPEDPALLEQMRKMADPLDDV